MDRTPYEVALEGVDNAQQNAYSKAVEAGTPKGEAAKIAHAAGAVAALTFGWTIDEVGEEAIRRVLARKTATLFCGVDESKSMDCKPFDQEAFEHIQGSSADPEFLAQLYGVSKQLVNLIQMGRVRTLEEARK